MSLPRKLVAVAWLVVASLMLQACYVTQDQNGQWWACEEFQTANGSGTACTPIERPF
jgi:hypothetical protein